MTNTCIAQVSPSKTLDALKGITRPPFHGHRCEALYRYPGLWILLQSCWAEDPSDRPQIDDVLAQLNAMVEPAD